MKKIIAFLVIGLCSAALAAVSITITVPDNYIVPVLNAMKTLSGKDMMIAVRGEDYEGRWHFKINSQDPNETNKDFAERFTKELLRASVRLVKSAKENQRYRQEISEVNPPDVNVPDEVIQ